jgi:flagellar hook-associated protein 3 FlgL
MVVRISTSSMYEGAARIGQLQSQISRTQQQIASNTKLLRPSDDPIASAKALQVSQAQAINTQLTANRINATNALSQQEGTLQSVTTLVQSIQGLVAKANSAALDDSQRGFIATELQGNVDELMGLANTKDGNGNYMFSGYSVGTQPFSKSATGAVYNGDQGQRLLQVGESRQMAVNNNGSEIFQNVRTGNGTFLAKAATGNAGSGVATLGSVTDSSLVTGNNYQIDFKVVDGVTTYDVIDTTVGLPALSTGNPFKDGDAIAFDGIQFEVKGAPVDGDSFSVAPSTTESVFTTLQNFVNTLGLTSGQTASRASLSAGLIQAGAGLDSMLENVLSVRSSLGVRLNELDNLDSVGSDRALQYSTQLADLTGIDLAESLSLLTQQTTTLQAALKTYSQISDLSLFNYI